MAHCLVTTKFYEDLFAELRSRLDNGEIRQMRPFGSALHALQYSLGTEPVEQGEGWAWIES